MFKLSKSIRQRDGKKNMEAIAFGFLAYFGAEIGEFTHRQYDEHLKCKIEVCEEQVELEQTIIIKIKQNDNVVSETRIGNDR